MNLSDLVQRAGVPAPWTEGDNIPWNEPGFSARMLAEHLTQDHDLASRRTETIDRHVDWIHREILREKPNLILDLGCGPGLYTSRLARLGHTCLGIDYSPASIDYAVAQASALNLPCKYIHQDLRQADFGTRYGLVMFIYGEPNVFSPAHIRLLLKKAYQALIPGGTLLLEPHTFDAVQGLGMESKSWWSSESGLFSERAHIVLQENFWHVQEQAATMRYFLIDAVSGEVTRYASSMQAYTNEGYHQLLEEAGFTGIHFYPGLTGEEKSAAPGLLAIRAMKPG